MQNPYEQQPPQYGAPGSPPLVKPSTHSRALSWTVAGIIAFVFLLCVVVQLLLISVEAGLPYLLISIVMAVLPVPIYVTLALWLDRFEAEPPKLLLFAFGWGAAIATFFAAIPNTIAAIIGGDALAALVSAPFFEETLKGAALFGFYLWKKDEFDGVIDGIVYAMMVGLGFAMLENIGYYAQAFIRGEEMGAVGGAAFLTFLLRGIFSAYAHPLFTSMTGIGLGFSRQSTNRAVQILAPLFGFGTAMLLHFVWNASASFGLGGFVLTYLIVMVPIFVGLLIVVVFSWRHEARIIRQQLAVDVHSGAITPAEYEMLSSVSGRMRASWRALSDRGYRAWRAQQEFHQMASELAFHRYRVMRGIHIGDDRAGQYFQRLRELRAAQMAQPARHWR